MRIFTLLVLLLMSLGTIAAQERAFTESGDTIYVYPDGTWSYELDLLRENKSFFETVGERTALDTSSIVYTSPAVNTKNLVSSNNGTTISYNPAPWKRMPPAQINELAEFVLTTPRMETFMMVINEGVEVGMENIYPFAKNNFMNMADSEPEFIQEEYRLVNGVYVVSSIFRAKVQSIDLTYHCYFHSGPEGTTQVFTWTYTKLYDKHKGDMEDVLNGLVIKTIDNED